jgi:hypothetical protein
MTTQSAIIVQGPGHAVVEQNVPIPELPDDYILVKTKAGKPYIPWGSSPRSKS